MALEPGKLLDLARTKGSILRWASVARSASKAKLVDLRRNQQKAKQLKAHLDQFLYIADERLAKPAIGSTNFPRPHNADWAWRPEIWRAPIAIPGVAASTGSTKLGNEVTLFHDCPRPELTARQLRNRHRDDLAPYGLALDAYHFDGSFLSIAVDLPKECTQGLARSHLLRVDVTLDVERPLTCFARLNMQIGPNVEKMTLKIELGPQNLFAEFDLAHTKIDKNHIDAAWVDLIFETPSMNQIALRDLTFARSPRAQY